MTEPDELKHRAQGESAMLAQIIQYAINQAVLVAGQLRVEQALVAELKAEKKPE